MSMNFVVVSFNGVPQRRKLSFSPKNGYDILKDSIPMVTGCDVEIRRADLESMRKRRSSWPPIIRNNRFGLW